MATTAFSIGVPATVADAASVGACLPAAAACPAKRRQPRRLRDHASRDAGRVFIGSSMFGTAVRASRRSQAPVPSARPVVEASSTGVQTPPALEGAELEKFLQDFDASGSDNLFLFQRELGPQGGRAVAEYLRKRIAAKGGSALRNLNLTINMMGDEAASEIARAVKEDKDLMLLVLSHNKLAGGSLAALEGMLQANRGLEMLDLAYNDLRDDGAERMVRSWLHSASNLRVMVLSGNNVTPAGGRAVAEAIRSMPKDRDLSFAGADEFKMVSGRELFLARNGLDGEAVEDIVGALLDGPMGSFLTSLALNENPIGDRGAAAMARCLKERNRFYRLDLDATGMGDEGVTAIADALRTSRSCTRIYLPDNGITDKGCVALAEALLENDTMSRLDLKNNSIGDEGAFALAKTVEVTQGLTVLELNGNKITAAGAEAVVEAAKKNTRVSVIGLKKLLQGK
eukprot:tig00021525_g22137.t1